MLATKDDTQKPLIEKWTSEIKTKFPHSLLFINKLLY